jgi:hypothetical protein
MNCLRARNTFNFPNIIAEAHLRMLRVRKYGLDPFTRRQLFHARPACGASTHDPAIRLGVAGGIREAIEPGSVVSVLWAVGEVP